MRNIEQHLREIMSGTSTLQILQLFSTEIRFKIGFPSVLMTESEFFDRVCHSSLQRSEGSMSNLRVVLCIEVVKNVCACTHNNNIV